jgi:hypothetical protein
MTHEIKKVAKATLGESKGFGPRGKNAETWDKYKISMKEAKKAVSEVKIQAFEGLYQSLEGEKSIYKLANGRERKTRDLDQVKCIKDEEGRVLVHERDI